MAPIGWKLFFLKERLCKDVKRWLVVAHYFWLHWAKGVSQKECQQHADKHAECKACMESCTECAKECQTILS